MCGVVCVMCKVLLLCDGGCLIIVDCLVLFGMCCVLGECRAIMFLS